MCALAAPLIRIHTVWSLLRSLCSLISREICWQVCVIPRDTDRERCKTWMLMNPTREVKYSGRKSVMEKTELCGSSCRLELEEVIIGSNMIKSYCNMTTISKMGAYSVFIFSTHTEKHLSEVSWSRQHTLMNEFSISASWSCCFCCFLIGNDFMFTGN